MPEIQISEKLILLFYFLPIFLMSLSIHEYAHAVLAFKFGDDTAQKQGRLTLNPIKHIDLIGSIVMPILAFTSGFMLIGWAKPVPVNRNKFKNNFRDDAIVSFAGPFSNLVFAILTYLIYLLITASGIEVGNIIYNIFRLTIIFNIFLFCFNLLPIPPLDGSHILFDLFPNKYTAKLLNLGIYGTVLLFLFIYSPLWQIFMNWVNWMVAFFNI
ncbi:MAG: site-2 protease family protein [Ignavibacteriales bacterium]|nr:site-2 protease family protein [Ignavibacteriota bacterium]MCB9248991.1 site-2 protease family protein [Ignavibacteriales bacterium]